MNAVCTLHLSDTVERLIHDEPRPPHSCFAKQNLRRKIFTGVGFTKERSVMKNLNHFSSLACWISGWTPTISRCMYESISNPFEYPAPARFPRALLGRCLWISGVLLLPSFLVDLCDWWPTAFNAILGQLWKYSCGLHYTSPANSNDLKDRRNSYHINGIIGRQIYFRV